MIKSIGELMSDDIQAQRDQNFLIYYDRHGKRTETSYADFIERVGCVVQFLDKQGIRRGDRIITLMQNKVEQVTIYFAAWAMGVCVAPVNLAESDDRIRFIVEQSMARAIFVQSEASNKVKKLLMRNQVETSVFSVEADDSRPLFAQAGREWKALLNSSIDDEALIVYTSGTTGKPKGVILKQKNLLYDAEAIAEWHQLQQGIRMMCVLPIHHVNGIVVTLVTPFFCRGTVILNERFSVSYFWERIDREQVQIVSVVPTLLEFLLEVDKELQRVSFTSLRHIICGAGPLLVETALSFEKKFNVPIIHGYGLSETTCYSSFLPIDLSDEERRVWLSKYGFPSIGTPIKHNQMAILDEHGTKQAEGKRGEIAIRGETVMEAYDKRADANAEAFRHGGGWFMTGDEGFYKNDQHGRPFFFITGRIKELIIRGGINLSPLEIDEVLKKHPKVQHALAVPFENRFYGEEIAAYIVPKEGMTVTESELIQHCAQRLPFIKQPKVFIFGDELPYTATGKPKRLQLKEQLKKQLSVHRNIQFRAENADR
ncbi:hypothetical protein BEP19_06325 [Ammoniphilus oxalaticus]|uniref:Long-chain fatty acid--CoA ligase n=1 Tax=Ammoniphilus oxalaticus TaxID=66863 RepID=A0A419SJ92_9BACL|nr:AMP-binding protein [Ammoniphilus oxalaticus]RKD24022.1 hypothetical protein BEP19_06325 [Ammoniphilus oxalaticus]